VTASVTPMGSHPQDGLACDAIVTRDRFRLAVELTVAPREVLGVLGPNGAGKTTLLRTLAGLVALDEGRLTLDGQVLDAPADEVFLAPNERPVGLVFQNYRLFPHLSVRDNVAFPMRSRGDSRKQAAVVAGEWLDRFGLSAFAHRKPAQLSGGQAQRVALARALAAEPRLLLLDEPLSALDARTRLEVRAELRRHLRDFDGPTLLVTHDPLEAMVMTDRLLVLENGLVVQHGRPADIARRPATQYVARLVGLNLYSGTVAANRVVQLDDGGSLVPGGLDPVPPDQTSPSLSELGDRVLVAIRPTAIAVHTSRPEHASPRNVWPGRVTGLELLADRVRVEVTGSPSALIDITAAAAAELGLADGRSVWLSAKATEVDVYPHPDSTVETRASRVETWD
jgi:molybdate transport system ATP-binding protein